MQSAIDPYLIKVEGLSKAFAGVLALDAVSLRIRENLLYAVAGPDGAGKTTLINILATCLRPDSGTVAVAGHDVVGDGAAGPPPGRAGDEQCEPRRRPDRGGEPWRMVRSAACRSRP